MSKIVDFMFNNMSRIGEDDYNLTQDAQMNNGQASYNLTNLNNNNDNKMLDMMSKYPTISTKGTYQLGPNGNNVDNSSKLLQSKMTNNNCKISLQERSYLTIPYLGRGNVDVGLENSLKFGTTLKEKKSSSQLNEQEYCDLKSYPLNKDLKQSMNEKRIEESAVKGWIRGGLPSREIYKNEKTQCN